MRFLFLMITLTALTGYILADEQPTFRWAVVHDPSIIKVGNMYYVFGTHLQVAKSKDLMHWEQINTSAHDKNPIIPNINEELKETLSWARTRNDIWAPQVIQLSDGRYYMYYCASTLVHQDLP